MLSFSPSGKREIKIRHHFLYRVHIIFTIAIIHLRNIGLTICAIKSSVVCDLDSNSHERIISLIKMGEINFQVGFQVGYTSIDSIKEIILVKVILWIEPFFLEFSPYSFGNVQMGRIWRKKENVQSSFCK